MFHLVQQWNGNDKFCLSSLIIFVFVEQKCVNKTSCLHNIGSFTPVMKYKWTPLSCFNIIGLWLVLLWSVNFHCCLSNTSFFTFYLVWQWHGWWTRLCIQQWCFINSNNKVLSIPRLAMSLMNIIYMCHLNWVLTKDFFFVEFSSHIGTEMSPVIVDVKKCSDKNMATIFNWYKTY